MKCLKCGVKIPEGTTHHCGIVPRVVRKEDCEVRGRIKYGSPEATVVEGVM